MALEPFRLDMQGSVIRPSLFTILFWGLWLAFISGLPWTVARGLDGLGLMLVFGAFWWTPFYAAFFIVLMSWIYSAFSLMPSGLFWVVSFSMYLLLHLVSSRFTMSNRLQLAGTLFVVICILQFVFAVATGQILNLHFLTWKLTGGILSSAFIQAALASVFAGSLMRLIEAK